VQDLCQHENPGIVFRLPIDPVSLSAAINIHRLDFPVILADTNVF